MPKEISHIYFAEKIYDQLESNIQLLIKQFPRVYFFGSVSPDLFYYYLPLSKKFPEVSTVPWGEIIHDHKENMSHIYYLLDYAKQTSSKEKELIFSFVAGYLTHVSADTFFHPYIYSITGHYYDSDIEARKKARRYHRLFETCMDLFILKNYYQTTIQKFSLNQKIFLPEDQEKILNLFAIALKNSYRENLSDEEMRRFVYFCYKLFKKLISIFQKKNWLSLLIPFRNIPVIADHLALCYIDHPEYEKLNFISFFPAPHPVTGNIISGSFENFTTQIIPRAIQWIQASYRFIQEPHLDQDFLKENIPHYSLNTGLIQISNTQMQYFKYHPLRLQ